MSLDLVDSTYFHRLASRSALASCLWLSIALGCGRSESEYPPWDTDVGELDPAGEKFAERMAWFDRRIPDVEPKDRDYLVSRLAEHLAYDTQRRSPKFLETATRVFGPFPIAPHLLHNPWAYEGLVELARSEGRPEAREWLAGYRESPKVIEKLTFLLDDAVRDLDPGDAITPARATRMNLLLDELESLRAALPEKQMRQIARAALRSRLPRLVEHLAAGLPRDDQPFGEPSSHASSGAHPAVLGACLDISRSLLDSKADERASWDRYEARLDAVVEHASQAPAAEGLWLARFGLEESPGEVLARFRGLSTEAREAFDAWRAENPEEELSESARFLVAIAEPDDPEARAVVIDWIDRVVSPRFDVDRPWSLDLGAETDAFERAEEILELVAERRDEILEESLVAKAWGAQLLALRELESSQPELVAARLIEAMKSSAYALDPHADPQEIVLRSARALLSDAPANPVIDEFYLRQISFERELTRNGALSHARERYGDAGLVDAVYAYLGRKPSYSASEFRRLVQNLAGLDDIEASVVRNLEREIVKSGGVDRVFWALKMLSLDLLDEQATEACIPLLEKLAQDTTSYRLVSRTKEFGDTTGRTETEESEEIRFAARASSLLERLR